MGAQVRLGRAGAVQCPTERFAHLIPAISPNMSTCCCCVKAAPTSYMCTKSAASAAARNAPSGEKRRERVAPMFILSCEAQEQPT